MNSKQSNDVDELTYEWPSNILKYETKFWAGLTITHMLAMALPFLLITLIFNQTGHPAIGAVLGVVGALAGLLVTRPFEKFGGMSLPVYLTRRFVDARQRPIIEMPMIMPSTGDEQIIIETWDGEAVMELGGD